MITEFAITELVMLRVSLSEAAGDCSLLETSVNTGLLLHDVCEALGLFPEQRLVVLGPELAGALDDYLNSPVTIDLDKLPVAVMA